MDFWTVIFRIDLILILIVGAFYAFRELQDFWYNHVEHRMTKAKLQTEATVEAVVARVTGAPAAVASAAGDAVDGLRNKVADGLEDTADAVRPDEDA